MSTGKHTSVSVITLAYNAEITIRRCIDSVLRQTFNDFELIVIDDGSQDRTANILDSYAREHSRISVIHQENKGIAISRQHGIDRAIGLYSIFLDADDWMSPTMLETLYHEATVSSADIVFCDFMEYNGLGAFYRKQEPCSIHSREVMKQMLGQLHGSLWNKMIRTSLYREKGIRFLEGLNYCEDEYVICRLLSAGILVSYVNEALYHYDKLANEQSVSNDWKGRPAEEYKLFLGHIFPLFDTSELRQNFNNRVGSIINRLSFAPEKEYNDARKLYYHYWKPFLRSNLPWPKKIFNILYFNGMRKPMAMFRERFQSMRSNSLIISTQR